MAEVVTCGVYDIAVPENWYVDLFYSEGDDKGLLELRKNPTTPMQTLYVRSSKLEDATVAATPEALSTYMEMTASLYTIADKAVDGAVADTGYMMLRDGGMAWRGIYENEEGTSFGRLVTVCGDESATVSIFAKDGDQQPSFVRFLLSP